MRGISLFIMNEKGLVVLKAILAKFGPGAIRRVVYAHDKGTQKDYATTIQAVCNTAGLLSFERTDTRIIHDSWRIVIGWQWRFEDISQTIIFHDSLLPLYRGFNPLVSALIDGQKHLGVTAFLASPEIDDGDVLAQLSTEICYPIKIHSAIETVASMYSDIAVSIVEKVLNGEKLHGAPQNRELISYSLWRDEHDYLIDWSKPSCFIKQFIDAVGFPYKGASTFIERQLVRIIDAVVVPDVPIVNRTPGKVFQLKDGVPVVVCGSGLIQLLNIIDDQSQKSILPLSRLRIRFSDH